MNTQKRKNNKLQLVITLGVITLLIACAVMLSMLSNNATVAYANTTGPATFMNTRRGARVNVSGLDPQTRARNFARFDFQRDSNNFRYIQGSAIASLPDSAHNNRTLRQQSYAIRNAQRGGSLTVMVHGQAGRASEWSNDGGDGETAQTYRQLAFMADENDPTQPNTSNSMIEMLAGIVD